MPRQDDLPFSPLPGRGADESQFWQAMIFEIFTTMRVCQPATVVAWTPPIPGTRPATVDLQLDFLQVRSIDNPTEVRVDQLEKLATTPTGLLAIGPRQIHRSKPYLVPSVGGAFSMRGPIAPLTTGLYIVADRCIDEWINLGGPLDPATADKHDLNDGFFLPLVYHGLNTAIISPDSHQLGPDDGTAAFEIAVADKSMRAWTSGPTVNVDAATLVQLGNPLGPMLGVARLTDKTSADTTMAVWMGQIQTIATAAAAFLGLPAPVFPSDFGFVSLASTKVVAE